MSLQRAAEAINQPQTSPLCQTRYVLLYILAPVLSPKTNVQLDADHVWNTLYHKFCFLPEKKKANGNKTKWTFSAPYFAVLYLIEAPDLSVNMRAAMFMD